MGERPSETLLKTSKRFCQVRRLGTIEIFGFKNGHVTHHEFYFFNEITDLPSSSRNNEFFTTFLSTNNKENKSKNYIIGFIINYIININIQNNINYCALQNSGHFC